MIIHLPALRDILGLECDLQAAATHSERHSIHVDEVIWGSTIANIVIFRPVVEFIIDSWVFPVLGNIAVFEYRDVDLDLAAATRTNIGSQGREPNMGVRNLVWDELRPKSWP